MDALLPPQTLQGRHHIVKVPLQLVLAHLAHFDGEGHGVEHSQGLLIGAVLLIGITLAPHRQEIHSRYRDDTRRRGRQIEFLVFFLVIKGHGHSSSSFGACFSAPRR